MWCHRWCGPPDLPDWSLSSHESTDGSPNTQGLSLLKALFGFPPSSLPSLGPTIKFTLQVGEWESTDSSV